MQTSNLGNITRQFKEIEATIKANPKLAFLKAGKYQLQKNMPPGWREQKQSQWKTYLTYRYQHQFNKDATLRMFVWQCFNQISNKYEYLKQECERKDIAFKFQQHSRDRAKLMRIIQKLFKGLKELQSPLKQVAFKCIQLSQSMDIQIKLSIFKIDQSCVKELIGTFNQNLKEINDMFKTIITRMDDDKNSNCRQISDILEKFSSGFKEEVIYTDFRQKYGKIVESELKIKAQQTQIQFKKTQMAKIQFELNKNKENLDNLNKEVQDKQAQIQTRQKNLVLKQAEINERQAKIKDTEDRLRKKQAKLIEQANQVDTKKQQNQKIRLINQAKSKELESLVTSNELLNKNLCEWEVQTKLQFSNLYQLNSSISQSNSIFQEKIKKFNSSNSQSMNKAFEQLGKSNLRSINELQSAFRLKQQSIKALRSQYQEINQRLQQNKLAKQEFALNKLKRYCNFIVKQKPACKDGLEAIQILMLKNALRKYTVMEQRQKKLQNKLAREKNQSRAVELVNQLLCSEIQQFQ